MRSNDEARRSEGRPETFDFLGFTHKCAKTRHDRSVHDPSSQRGETNACDIAGDQGEAAKADAPATWRNGPLATAVPTAILLFWSRPLAGSCFGDQAGETTMPRPSRATKQADFIMPLKR